MNWQKEVKGWINSLLQEIEGLKTLSQNLNSDTNLSSQVSSRLLNVISLLKEGMLNLIDKSNSLLKFQTEPGTKIDQLRSEYHKVIKSLSNLFKTVNESTDKPHYNFSTFASRKRSLSKRDLSPGIPKPTVKKPLTPRKPENFEVFEEKKGFFELKSEIKHLKQEIEDHEHEEYQQKILFLEEENKAIKKLIEQLSNETKENLKSIPNLKSRIEALETRKTGKDLSPNNKKSRFLLKSPSGDNSFKHT